MDLQLPMLLVEPVVRRALEEDIGRAGDITSHAVIAADQTIRCAIRARRSGVVSGLSCAASAFWLLDPEVKVAVLIPDGGGVEAGGTIAFIEGNARAVLTAERVALNFLGHMSGIATATWRLTALIDGLPARITCTRKTTPNLRIFEKYAVRCGGGQNHRFGLDDAILIKDNHIALAGGIRPAVERARQSVGHLVKIEVEVDNLDQLAELLELPVDAVLLDNMDNDALKQAVTLVNRRMICEASGGVSELTVRGIAETGVDLISVGAITHSAPCLDLGLDVL